MPAVGLRWGLFTEHIGTTEQQFCRAIFAFNLIKYDLYTIER